MTKNKLSKSISKFILLFWARLVLIKYQPLVIGITGSLGKTTTTKFATALLGEKIETIGTEYEFATSLTAPLTILRVKKPKKTKNIFWFLPYYSFKALELILLRKKYPQCFVLELRSDVRAGQSMKGLIRSLRPKVGIVTAVQPVHLTYFKTISRIARAKRFLIESLPPDGLALLNFDDPRVKKMANFTQAPVLFYGLSPRANIRAKKIKLGTAGLSFEIRYRDKIIPVKAPHLINRAYIYPILAAIGLSLTYTDPSVEQIIQTVSQLQSIEGRGNLINGIKGTFLINDAFNATPQSVLAALDSFSQAFKEKRKIVVLGDMLQMERLTQKSHQQVGQKVAQINPDLLVTVGQSAKIIGRQAIKLGYPSEQALGVNNFREAASLLRSEIKGGEAILFKGSHGMKLYKIIERLQR